MLTSLKIYDEATYESFYTPSLLPDIHVVGVHSDGDVTWDTRPRILSGYKDPDRISYCTSSWFLLEELLDGEYQEQEDVPF